MMLLLQETISIIWIYELIYKLLYELIEHLFMESGEDPINPIKPINVWCGTLSIYPRAFQITALCLSRRFPNSRYDRLHVHLRKSAACSAGYASPHPLRAQWGAQWGA